MKNLFTLAFMSLIMTFAMAQAPQKMSYQAVVRDNSGQLIALQAIGMKVSIATSAAGTPIFTETHTPNTNANGLISIEIGTGSVVTGDLASIDWANGPYYIQTSFDLSGGTNYVEYGSTELLSVPYALYANSTRSSNYFESSSLNDASYDVGSDFEPISRTLSITKEYADSKIEAYLDCNAQITSRTNSNGVYFQIRIDGVAANIDSWGSVTEDGKKVFISATAIFENLSAGAHTIQVYARAANGGSATGVVLDPGGWGARIIAKETF